MTYLAGAAALASFIVGCLGAYFGWRALFPAKRELTLNIQPSIDLLPHISATGAAVELTIDGKPVEVNSKTASLTIQNTGRYDVGGNTSPDPMLLIDLGIAVASILSIDVDPPRGKPPTVTPNVNGFAVHPALLSRGQTVTVQVVCAKSPSKLVRVSHDLPDVKIRTGRGVRPLTRARRVGSAAGFALAGAGVIGVMIPILLLHNSQAALSVHPEFVNRGDAFRVVGSHFRPHAPISASLHGMNDFNGKEYNLGSTQVDANGSFVLRSRVPSSGPTGPVEITVTSEDRGSEAFHYVDFDVAIAK